MPLKIVVTGALGHVGSYLVRDLPRQFPGVEIVMIDNLRTGRYASLFDLPASGRYRFIEADVIDIDIRPLLHGADAVVHLAAITDSPATERDAEETEVRNYAGTMSVAQACADAQVRFVGSFSTSVYAPQGAIVSEDCPPEDLAPQSTYARTKLREEELVARLSAEEGLDSVSFRFGTIFGVSPGMHFHTAVSKFCWQAAMGQPITVWRTAYDQTRPYLDVRDASRAIGFAVREDLLDGGIFNVQTESATVRQVIDIIRESVPDVQVTFVDDPNMNRLSYEVSCRRLVSRGFALTGDLRQGIRETLDRLERANSSSRETRLAQPNANR